MIKAFTENKWLWVHILGGGFFAKIFLTRYEPQQAVLLVLGVALLWEVGEFILSDVERIYGSRKRFYLDAIGDIIGALTMALVVAA